MGGKQGNLVSGARAASCGFKVRHEICKRGEGGHQCTGRGVGRRSRRRGGGRRRGRHGRGGGDIPREQPGGSGDAGGVGLENREGEALRVMADVRERPA